jgi:hypothetical protein
MMRVAIFNDTRGDQGHLGCTAVMDQLEALIAVIGGEVTFRWPFDRDWREAKDALPRRSDIDAIIVNGEGTMHGSPTRKNAVALAELGQFAKQHYGVPIALVNATLFNNDAGFYRSLKSFDLIWLRDEMSCNTAREHGLSVRYCPDLSMSHDWSKVAVLRQNIGVTGSVKHRDDLRLRKFASAAGAEFRSMVRVERSSPKKIMTLRVGELRKAWRARNRYLDLGPENQPKSPEALISWIASKSLIVTGRYHTATLCILTSTPFLFLGSNTPKITALCENVGIRTDRLIEDLDAYAADQGASAIAAGAFDEFEKAAVLKFLDSSRDDFDDLRTSLTTLFSTATSDRSKA